LEAECTRAREERTAQAARDAAAATLERERVEAAQIERAQRDQTVERTAQAVRDAVAAAIAHECAAQDAAAAALHVVAAASRGERYE
jgi:hypothetical protein